MEKDTITYLCFFVYFCLLIGNLTNIYGAFINKNTHSLMGWISSFTFLIGLIINKIKGS